VLQLKPWRGIIRIAKKSKKIEGILFNVTTHPTMWMKISENEEKWIKIFF